MSDLLRRRLTAQLLAGSPARSPAAVAQRLLAIQSQDPRGGRLAVRARSTVKTAGEVDRALNDRELLITWVNRGTLHLIRGEDYPLLQLLTTPPLVVGNTRRLRQEGVSEAKAEKGVRLIESALAAGPQTRFELRDRLRAGNVPTAGQALSHVLFLAALRGVAVRGPLVGREHAFVLVRDWLPKPPKLERESALAELARRYLVGHGPASAGDLARWAGLPLRDAKAGFERIARELVEEGELVRLRGSRMATKRPLPKLLGVFEPLLLGWNDRSAFEVAELSFGGLMTPFVLVDGRGAGSWKLRAGKVSLELDGGLSAADRDALAAEAAAVERFFAY